MVPQIIRFTLTRKKIGGLLLGACLSFLAGCLAGYAACLSEWGEGRFILFFLAALFFVFTLFCLKSYWVLRKEKFTGIYISDEGIYDVSTGGHIGTVLWKDVEAVRVMHEVRDRTRKYIVLQLSNPDRYIQRESLPSKKRTLELKLQYYGSPICFSNRALNCTFSDLHRAVMLKYDQYREKHQPRQA